MPTVTFWDEILTVAQSAATHVGQQLLRDFGQVQATEKSDGSLVTRADQWADQTLHKLLTQAFPQHGILSEEGEHRLPESEWCWVIDPLDGTTNFTRGIPIWAVSLGLLFHGTPVFGLVHLPTLNQTFTGFWQAPGHENEASLNQTAIHTRQAAPSPNQFFSLCARSISVLRQPFPAKIRMLGAASYNFLTVAAGATLGGVEATPKIWDIAAVYPIVCAAGGSWVPLHTQPPFPLTPGKAYSQQNYPTLVVSHVELISTFLPLVQSIATKA